jgi:NDP-sugar pyrophosphorylase family protein
MKAVILAGGKGSRLKPYTTVFPKPLMPVGNMPILEIIIRQLKSQGITDIIIAVGHLGELIMNFFGDGSKLGVNIRYSREEQPLGTAGGLGLIREELKDTFLMINGDILTTLNFSDLIDYHRKNEAIITIALKQRETYINFGIAELDNTGRLTGYTEKPTLHHLVSMGAYVCEPGVLEYVRTGQKLDFPDLVKTLLAEGKIVKGFVFEGYWLDIGRPDDYEKANEEIEEIYPKLLNQQGE